MEQPSIELVLETGREGGLPLEFSTTAGYIRDLGQQVAKSREQWTPCLTVDFLSIEPLGARVNNHLTNPDAEYESISVAEIGTSGSNQFTGHDTRVTLVVKAGEEHLTEIGTLAEEAHGEAPLQWTTTVPDGAARDFVSRAKELSHTIEKGLPATIPPRFECEECGNTHARTEVEKRFVGCTETGAATGWVFSIRCPETEKTFKVSSDDSIEAPPSQESPSTVRPDDAQDLENFLSENPADAYEITLRDDGAAKNILAKRINRVEPSQVTLAQPPVFKLAEITEHSGLKERSVHVDDIQRVERVPSLPKRLVPADATPSSRAEGLSRLARVAPGDVDITEVTALLSGDSFPERRYSLFALRYLIDERTEDCVMTVPQLRSILGEGQTRLTEDALYCLATIAQHSPSDVAPAVDSVGEFLEEGPKEGKEHAATVVMEVAGEDASDILDLVPALADALGDRDPGVRSRAAYALSRAATEDAEAVRPVTDSLAEVVTDDDASENTKLNAISALGRVASDHPNVAVDVLPELAELLESEHHKLRANAAGAISDVAKIHTMAVRDHLSSIAPLLTDDDDFVRVNVSATISRVAEDFPEDVTACVPALIECLDDAHPVVRENACWGLGYLRAERARDKLKEVRTEDSEESVRTRAEWALTQIESG